MPMDDSKRSHVVQKTVAKRGPRPMPTIGRDIFDGGFRPSALEPRGDGRGLARYQRPLIRGERTPPWPTAAFYRPIAPVLGSPRAAGLDPRPRHMEEHDD